MNNDERRKSRKLKLCRVATVPITFYALFRQQIKVLIENGISVTLVSSPGEELDLLCQEYSLPGYSVPMSRKISPLQDLRALFLLFRLFRREKFDIVHTSTPKAGLLGALAGWLARIPIRLHTYTGQAWVELHGLRRLVVLWSDKVIGRLNKHCYADSFSQRDFLIKNGIVSASKISVLVSGSVSGVDFDRFNPEVWRGARAEETHRGLHIASDALIILFVGRLTRDKGIAELVSAFNSLDNPEKVELVLVGPFEPGYDLIPKPLLDLLSNHPRIHKVGFTNQPEKFMAIADVLCLPSYREGFGSVIIEAAAMGVPAVATSIVGLVDAVVPDVTGLLVPPKDQEALREALSRIISDTGLRQRMGRAALKRARALYDAAVVNQAMADEYYRISSSQWKGR